MKKLAWVLLIVGGLNWGLVGLGWLFGGMNWNVVNLIFGNWMVLEGVIYLLVGISAAVVAFGSCGCKTCTTSGQKM